MMTRRHFALCAATLPAVLSLGGCGDDRFPDYRYKMTIYVTTADGEKIFSSVRQIRQKEVSSLADSSGRAVETKLTGEAVIIDQGDGRTTYALLSRPDEADYGKKVAGYALLPRVPKEERDPRFDDLRVERGRESLDRQARRMQAMVAVKGPVDLLRTRPNPDPYRGPRELNNWPMFVTFSDPTDPRTVREVSPDSLGVRRITIEITDESVSTGIEGRLPSFGPQTGFQEWYRSIPVGDPRQITKSHFRTKPE